jgi:hypothetical protein
VPSRSSRPLPHCLHGDPGELSCRALRYLRQVETAKVVRLAKTPSSVVNSHKSTAHHQQGQLLLAAQQHRIPPTPLPTLPGLRSMLALNLSLSTLPRSILSTSHGRLKPWQSQVANLCLFLTTPPSRHDHKRKDTWRILGHADIWSIQGRNLRRYVVLSPTRLPVVCILANEH